MRTNFPEEFLATESGARANEILRSCVHCGFCNATCPTYQLTGDELDGPRGRIYLINELFETGENTARAEKHLDRCLTCRACETTCPSGVAYGDLVEIARNELGPDRKGAKQFLRRGLLWLVPNAGLTRRLVNLGKMFRLFLPKVLAHHLPRKVGNAITSSPSTTERSVLVLNGCAQQVSTGGTNEALQSLLASQGYGVRVATEEVCCGSLALHLGDEDAALESVRRNVDALFPFLEQVDAIVSTASGCGVTVKDYGRLLANDRLYAFKAAAVADKTVDVSEFVARGLEDGSIEIRGNEAYQKVAWHSPCTLQHGQKINGVVETVLEAAGYELVEVADSHLCCGSAGTYSMLEPKLSLDLKNNKVAALTQHSPDVIATANVGCQSHLGADSQVPVVHWIELVN